VAASRRRRRWIPGRTLGLLALLGLAVLAYRAAYALYPCPYRGLVVAAARADGLDPRLVYAVMRVESRFDPNAVSRDGAVGLMQLTPGTAAWVAGRRGAARPVSPQLLRDPAFNIAAGSWYLAYLCASFGGRLPPAVAAYNAGRTPVADWLHAGLWDATLGGAAAIPFPETRVFVQRVLGAYAVYRLLYPAMGSA
jgi:soluble lytic murein transglycosylase